MTTNLASKSFLRALQNARVEAFSSPQPVDKLGQVNGGVSDPSSEDPINVPNAITLVGYGLGLWWIGGGPAWAAVASIVLDEADGAIARELNQTTEFGNKFDWASDIILTALTLRKLRCPFWTVPSATVGQVYLRNKGYKPPLGSLRGGLMLYGVVVDGYRKKLAREARAR